MSIDFAGAQGPPDVLPFGYGENTGGQYGRLRVADAPDYVTNRPPFRGPGGTTPLNRGGPNLPAYAPPIQEAAGGVIPATTAWPGTTNQAPVQPSTPYAQHYQWAGFGYNDARGMGAPHPTYGGAFDFLKADPGRKQARQQRRAIRQSLAQYRDEPGKNGHYLYRQYADGRIQILSGPWGEGKMLTSTGQHAAKWRAITAEIGPFALASGAVTGLTSALTALTALSTAAAPLIGQQAPAMPEETYVPEAAPATGGIPTVAWVVGGVALLGGIVMLARRS